MLNTKDIPVKVEMIVIDLQFSCLFICPLAIKAVHWRLEKIDQLKTKVKKDKK